MDWTLPAQHMGPPDTVEENELPECDYCGELRHPMEGCMCSWIEVLVYDRLEAGE